MHPNAWSSQNHCENREIRHPNVKAGSEAVDENLDPFHHARWVHIHLHPLEAEVVPALEVDLEDDKDEKECCSKGLEAPCRGAGLDHE